MNFIIALLLLLCCWCFGVSTVFAFYPNSPGETIPDRVEIAADNDLIIYCTMNPWMFPTKNSTHLDFYVGDQAVGRHLIETVNATTIVMRMRNAAPQETRYRCQCGKSAIMESLAFVGTKPERVRDFTCRSYDYTYMVCNFTKPYNPVVVQYNLTFYTTSPAYKNTMHCEFSDQIVCNTTAYYRACTEQYHFVLRGSNALGWEQQEFRVNNFDVMVLAAPGKDVTVAAGYPTTDAILLSWHMQRSESCRSNNFQWEILLQPDAFATIDLSTQPIISRNSQKEWTLQLLDLPYAFYWYTLRLRVKVRSAANTEEMWSEPLIYRFRTAARAPARPPRTSAGSYYIESSETKVRLYWEELQPHEYAGENFTYTISEVRCNDNVLLDQKPLQLEMNSALFELQKHSNCEFLIRSQNSHGVSPNASRIVVFAHSNSKSRKPRSIHNLYHDGNGTYTLSWKSPMLLERLRNYTVYWCKSKRALQNGCNGSIHFAQLSKDVHRFTTTPQDHSLNLAVSADYDNYNTGMHWTACTLDVNSDLVKIEPEARAIRSSALQIEWSPESVCPSILDGYNLTYCEVSQVDSATITTTNSPASVLGGVVESPHSDGFECITSPISLKIDKNSRKYIVEPLKPFTMYKLEMFMYSPKKVGKVSDSLLTRTLEAAPSPPRQLNVTHVTNTSATFSWLPPILPNGVIRDYVLTLNNQQYWIEAPPQYDGVRDVHERIVYEVSNLTSYTSYTAYVVANTVDHSAHSNDVHFITMISYPSMPSNTWVLNSINDTTIQWHRPAKPSGRVEFYEVAVTQTRHQVVIKKRISFVAGETMCLVKSQQCTDPEVRTKFEVRAVNAALLTHEVNEFVAGEGFSTHLDEWPAADNSYWDADELSCIGVKHSPQEVEHLVAAYRNRSQYQLYHSSWQFAYENSCAATGLSKKAEVALIVIVAALILIGPFYMASKKYTKMANINCKLPSDLDVYVTKDGPPRDDYRQHMYDSDVRVAPTTTNATTTTSNDIVSRPLSVMQQQTSGSDFISHNEKHHLLAQNSSSSDTNDSAYLHADPRLFKRDDSIDCSLDCGSSVKTQQSMLSHLDSGNETGGTTGLGNLSRRYLRSQSECSARSVLSDEPEEEEDESSLETVEMDQMLLVQPNVASSSYVDSSTFTMKDLKPNGYVNPTSFANWPGASLHTTATVMPSGNGYIRANELSTVLPPTTTTTSSSSPYVQASDLHDLHLNMTTPQANPPPSNAAQPSGYMTLEDLQKFSVAPDVDAAETALLASTPTSRTNATNYINPSSLASKVVGPIGGYVTPRDLNVLAGTDQH